MAHETDLLHRRQTDFEQAVLLSHMALRRAFVEGIHGDLHAPIPSPGFEPRAMPTWQVVHSMLIQVDADGTLLVDMLRVVVRAAEGYDPVLCGMAQALIARLASKHALMHREEHAEALGHD